MFAHLRSPSAASWFAALYALAMLVLGFAHRPALAATIEPPGRLAAAFVLPGGIVSVLCIGDDGTVDPHAAASAICDACLLAAAPGLPPAAALSLGRAATAIAASPDVVDLDRPQTVFAPVSRGPPGTAAA